MGLIHKQNEAALKSLECRLVMDIEGDGKSGWWIFAARDLRCCLISRGIVDHYETDYTFGKIATRKLSKIWLTWLRSHHSGTTEDAIEFSKLVSVFNPELVGTSEPFPKGYQPPFAYREMCFERT